jgi:hypothetical protein
VPLTLAELESLVHRQGERIAKLELQLMAMRSQADVTQPNTQKRAAIKRLISRVVASESLGICTGTFGRHWSSMFSDPRAPEDQ